MDADDASFAEMRRRHADPDADPLALDEETVEQLLSGRLSPSQAPPRYAEVAALLAATAAPPTPEELAGQAAALAELRAVTRVRAVGSRRARAAKPPRRRRFTLAAVVVVGALVTGGVAAAATGRLPGPVQEAARSILDTAGGAEPGTPTQPAPAQGSHASTPGPAGAGQRTRPTAAGGPGPATTGAAASPNPNLEGLCQAYLSSKGAEKGRKLESAAFQPLVHAAGGKEKVPGYCQDLLPEDKKDKAKKEPAPPDDPGQGQGQGGPPPSTGGDNNGQGGRADERS
jgi:hypothetical protein